MHISIDIDKICQFVSVFLLLLYAFTFGLEKYLYHGSSRVELLTFMAALILMMLCSIKRVHIRSIDLLVLLMMFVVIFNRNQNTANHYYSPTQATIAVLLFYVFSHENEEWHRMVLNIMMCAGIFYALCTIIFMYTPDFYKNSVLPIFSSTGYTQQMSMLYDRGYMSGFTPHYSTNAIYLSVALGVPATYILNAGKQKVYWAAGIIIMAALLFTGKRAHCVFGILALILSYYYLNCDKPVKRWFKIIFGLAVGTAMLVIVSEWIPETLNFVSRFIETAMEGDVSKGRDRLRLEAWEMFGKHKWLGIGWDGFKYEYLSTNNSLMNVHCVYVQLLCECGILGSLPFFMFFVVALWHSIGTLVKLVKSEVKVTMETKTVLSFSIYIEIFFLLYCFTGNPLYDAQMLFPYILACSMGEYFYRFWR